MALSWESHFIVTVQVTTKLTITVSGSRLKEARWKLKLNQEIQ